MALKIGVVLALAVAADGKSLVAATADGVVVVLDSATGKELRRLFGHTSVSCTAITPDGRMINNYRLDDPVFSDDHILQWTANAVRQSFSLDFMHWSEQLQTVSGKFSADGWRHFLEAMKKSNNLETLTKLKMVSDAQVTGAPKLLQKAVLGGHYVWKIELPILVTYNNNNQVIPMPMEVTVIVMRVPVEQNPERIAINNFLPIVHKSQLQ